MAKKPHPSEGPEAQAATLAAALLRAHGIEPSVDAQSLDLAEKAYLAVLKGATCHRLKTDLSEINGPLLSKTGDRRAPLVERHGNLYLQSYDALEAELADNVTKKLGEAEGRYDVDKRWTEGCDVSQAAAIRLSGTTNFMILTGGPGTGKTATATRILASAMVDGKVPIDGVRLCAPTGRAASRLRESVLGDRASTLQSAGLEVNRLQPAQTLHSLLRRDENFAGAKLFLVDECSMADLHIFAQFMKSVPTGAKVILLGDPRQLPSVETGSVFADLCRAEHLKQARANLTKNHRLPQAVHDAAARVMGSSKGEPVALLAPAKDAIVEACLGTYTELKAAAEVSDHAAIDRLMNAVRVLCSHRGGPTGVNALNLAIQARLGLKSAEQPGQVIMVTRNDAKVTGLMNGDVGVVVPGRRAKFLGRPLTFALSDLRAKTPAFATTIHQSQGSEYDRVILVLSDSEQEDFLTRELLFTGITRAKQHLGPGTSEKPAIFSSKAAYEKMTNNKCIRASGLTERLGGEDPSTESDSLGSTAEDA